MTASSTRFSEADVRRWTEHALAAADADEVEAVFVGLESGLTRFADNYIHQNVAEWNAELRIRAVVDRRVGVATTNALDEAAIAEVVARASALARHQPERPDWPGLPQAEPAEPMPPVDEATASAGPEVRAELVGVVCRRAKSDGVVASGALSTDRETLAVANSGGVWQYGARSKASWVTVVMGETGSGYSAWTGTKLSELDAGGLADEAVGKALRSANPKPIDPGTYPVVLEPYATASLVSYLGMLGFNGRGVVEGRSFLADRRGEQVTHPDVSIHDDHRHPGTLPLSFDFEGVPRQRVVCIESGVARNAVWDRESAAEAGADQRSTGHALAAPNSWGPVPLHLQMAPGNAGREALLAGIERGLWITRFNYVRPVQPKQTVITGLTRDGTFLIENGRVGPPVSNLRFTQSILEALQGLEAIGSESATVDLGFGTARVPALRLGAFRFSGGGSSQ